MRFFSKEETVVVALILGVIALASLLNFRTSLRRARDVQRKDDLGSTANALEKYRDDFGAFPLASSDGKILACVRPGDKITYDKEGRPQVTLIACEWGKDSLRDILDPNSPPYLELLPGDPQRGMGLTYIYFSNGKRYQIYASLEGKDEDEYDPKIIARGIQCGTRICNFGRVFGKTPLDKSIEEYENEINKLKVQN